MTSARMPRTIACATLVLFALTGCSTVKVKLGLRVSIAKLPVTSIETHLQNDPGIAPGEKSALIVTFTQPDGTTLATEGKGKGKVLWKDLTVTTTLVTFNNKGTLSLAHDPRKSDGKTGHVTVTVPSHPDLHADLDIPLRYDYPFAATYSGTTGRSGSDGQNGIDGTSGSPGSLDPDNPSPGGNGTDGTNGTDGDNGQPGDDGPAVTVRVTLRPGPHPLLQASVQAAGQKQRFYLIDTVGDGSLTVTSDGGAGGAGGTGGRGGSGGSGGIGSPNGSSGSNGLSGHDGFRGASGGGGKITLTYDPQVTPYLGLIHLSSPGGPKPVLKEEPVAALW